MVQNSQQQLTQVYSKLFITNHEWVIYRDLTFQASQALPFRRWDLDEDPSEVMEEEQIEAIFQILSDTECLTQNLWCPLWNFATCTNSLYCWFECVWEASEF